MYRQIVLNLESISTEARLLQKVSALCFCKTSSIPHLRLWDLTLEHNTHTNTRMYAADKASCEFLPDDVDFCERWVEIPDSATRERCPGFDCCASDYGEFYEENFCEDLQCDDRGPNNVMCVEDNCNQGTRYVHLDSCSCHIQTV